MSLALRFVPTTPVVVAIAMALGLAVGISSTRDGLVVPATLLVAAGIVVSTLRRPLVGILAFVVIATLLPFAVVPLRLIVAPTLVDVTVTALLAAWIARVLLRRDPLQLTLPVAATVVFMCLAGIALVAGSALARLGAEEARLFAKLLNSVLLFVPAGQVLRSLSDVKVVLRTVIVGGTMAAVIALGLHVLPAGRIVELLSALEPVGYPTGPGVLRPIVLTETLRATGTSVDPNVLGGMLMLVAAVVVAQLLASQPVLPRWSLVLASLPLLLAIGLSYSRSAWVGFTAALVYLAIFKDRRVWLAVGVGAVGLIAAPPGRAVLARLVSGFGAQDPASALRVSEYRDALILISQYPWLGVGFGDPPRIDLYIGVSNVYLQITEQVGLLGLGAFLIVLGIVLVRSLPVRVPRTDESWGLLTSLQAAMVATLVAGLFDHYFFNLRFPHMVGLFWLTMGMLSVTAGLLRYGGHWGGSRVEHVDA